MAEANSTQHKSCAHCSAPFKSIIAKAKYCSDKCQRAHYRRTKMHGPFVCQFCGGEFYKKNCHRNMFCTGSCRTKAQHSAKSGGSSLGVMRACAAEILAINAVLRAERAALARIALAVKSLLVEVQCNCCGISFVRSRRWKSSCSFACIKKGRALSARVGGLRRRARMRGAEYDKINPIKVFERDKWRCHLCGKRTIKSLRGSKDKRAPELEHIVSLADGGTHTWGNVACSCRGCNGKKGSASFGQLGLGFAA